MGVATMAQRIHEAEAREDGRVAGQAQPDASAPWGRPPSGSPGVAASPMPGIASAEDGGKAVSSASVGPSGCLREEELTDTDRHIAVAIHLTPFASLFGVGPLALLIPLVIWLIRKDESAFNDDHGREIINFGLSQLVIHVLLALTAIGILLWPVLWIVIVVSLIRAAIAAGRGEYFRYPMTFRFLS